LDVSLELHGVEVMDEEKGEIAVLVSYVDERRWKAGFGDERGGKVGEERSFAVGVARFGGSGEMEVGRLVGCEFKMVSSRLSLSRRSSSVQHAFSPMLDGLRTTRVVASSLANFLSSVSTCYSEHRPSAPPSPFLHHPSLFQHRIHHSPIFHPHRFSLYYRGSLRGSHHSQRSSEERVPGNRIEQLADDEREDRGGRDHEGKWSAKRWSEAEGSLGGRWRVSDSSLLDFWTPKSGERKLADSFLRPFLLSQSCINSNRSSEIQD